MTPFINILGVRVSVLNIETAVARILCASVDPAHCGYVTVTGMHGLVESQKDPALQAIHNESFLTTPDGMSLAWLGQWHGHAEMDRVYGPELMDALFAASKESGLRHMLWGGGEGTAEALKGELLRRYPYCEIVGYDTPPFRPLTDEELASLHSEIQRTRPHCLWIGLSTPKQERFMHRFLQTYPQLTAQWSHGFTMLGVGAAFDFHAGRVRQAPRWIQRSGFEWFFRLLMDPKRLWKRYAFGNARYMWLLFLQLTHLRKFPLSN